MKPENTNSLPATQTVSVCDRVKCIMLLFVAGFLAQPATAGVQVVRFDPPLEVNAFADAPAGILPNILATDFNLDGEVDFRLLYGFGAMGAYFNSPTRFATRTVSSGVRAIAGPVAAVPLNSVIGSNIIASVASSSYAWSEGYTNRYDLTRPLGDHEASVILANAMPTVGYGGPVISFSTNGTLVTNTYYGGPVASGDIVGKEGVMALEFYVNGEPHYGYIHFDFRPLTSAPLSGVAGVVYGWAYETEPGVAIKATPLDAEEDNHGQHTGRGNRGRVGHPMR